MDQLEQRIREIVGRHLASVSRDHRHEIEQALIADLLAELRGFTSVKITASGCGTVIGVQF